MTVGDLFYREMQCTVLDNTFWINKMQNIHKTLDHSFLLL